MGGTEGQIRSSILNLLCVLFCQGAFGLGGQDWVGRHRVVAGSYEVTPPWFELVAGGTARNLEELINLLQESQSAQGAAIAS